MNSVENYFKTYFNSKHSVESSDGFNPNASLRHASLPEQWPPSACPPLSAWARDNRSICGRGRPAADEQDQRVKSEGRAAAKQTDSSLWMTAIHPPLRLPATAPLEHHMSAASYSAQRGTVSQCVLRYSGAWLAGMDEGGGEGDGDNLRRDLQDEENNNWRQRGLVQTSKTGFVTLRH